MVFVRLISAAADTGSSPVPATPKDTRNSILFLFNFFQLVVPRSAAADKGSTRDGYRGCSRYFETMQKCLVFFVLHVMVFVGIISAYKGSTGNGYRGDTIHYMSAIDSVLFCL
jgi:hypothetical protein